MGYTITIGNAVLKDYSDDPDGWDGQYVARFDVAKVTHPDAPTFPHDEMTGQSNERSPSYTAWADTMRAANLGGVFHPEGTESDARNFYAFAQHPGCQVITPGMLAQVSAAVVRWRETHDLPPGFMGWDWNEPEPTTHDATLARLLWLEWWMDWALKNCERPAIANS